MYISPFLHLGILEVFDVEFEHMYLFTLGIFPYK